MYTIYLISAMAGGTILVCQFVLTLLGLVTGCDTYGPKCAVACQAPPSHRALS